MDSTACQAVLAQLDHVGQPALPDPQEPPDSLVTVVSPENPDNLDPQD